MQGNPLDPRGESPFPARGGMAITPADADITFPRNAGFPKAISFGTAGTLSIQTTNGDNLTFVSGELSAGILHPICVKRVNSTGTTAANIKVYW